jgi:hypothetical protein
MKMLGLEDSLLVATTGNKLEMKNLASHPHKYVHENYGEKRGLKQYNLFHSVIDVIKKGLLKQPFALLHPDMILAAPLKDVDYGVTFHQEKFDISKPLSNLLHGESNLLMGDTMIFRGVEMEFFRNALESFERIQMENIGRMSPRDMKRAAWTFAARLNLRLKYVAIFCESSLLSLRPDYIIHYKHGMPPRFSKSNYSKEHDLALAQNPHDIIRRMIDAPGIDILRGVLESYCKT